MCTHMHSSNQVAERITSKVKCCIHLNKKALLTMHGLKIEVRPAPWIVIGCDRLSCHSAWQQPLSPPGNPAHIPPFPLLLHHSRGFFCSIRRGCHSNATLTRAVAVKRLDLDSLLIPNQARP